MIKLKVANKTFLAIPAAWVLSGAALAGSDTEAAGPGKFAVLFATTCMQHYYAPQQLKADMSARGPALEGDAAKSILGGQAGTAWAIQDSGDRFIVAWRNDGICAVYAQRAPAAETQSDFAALVATAPEPLVATPRETQGPNTGTTRTVSYAWHRPADKAELLFTLTTSTDADAKIQAMASMGLVKKSDSEIETSPSVSGPG